MFDIFSKNEEGNFSTVQCNNKKKQTYCILYKVPVFLFPSQFLYRHNFLSRLAVNVRIMKIWSSPLN